MKITKKTDKKKTISSGASASGPLSRSKGRPSTINDAVIDTICDHIALGESVRQICLLPGMPGETTVWVRLAKDLEFQKKYTRAKEIQADKFSEELLDISDDSRNDWVERENERTGAVFVELDSDHVQRSKLMVETRKWLMGKMKPKVYGDKIDLTSGGEKLAAPPAVLEYRIVPVEGR